MADHNSNIDWFDSQPTPAQKPRGDNSHNNAKAGDDSERNLVEENSVDISFDNVQSTNSIILKAQNMFHAYTKSEFISQIISDVEEAEVGLEELRDVLYTEIKSLKDFPYPQKVELKKRINSRRGESVLYKLASDVYSLVNVLDGAPYEEMKDILSQVPKNRCDMNSSMSCSQKNASNIDVIAASVAQLQADVLQLKEKNASMEALRKEVATIKAEMGRFQQEMFDLLSSLEKCVADNSLAVQRIQEICGSNAVKLKNDIKQIRAEARTNQESLEVTLRQTSAYVEKHSKQLDKRVSKTEGRLRAVESAASADQGYYTAQALGDSKPCVMEPYNVNLARSSQDQMQTDIAIIGEERPIGKGTASSEGQLLYAVTENGPSFSRVRVEDPPPDTYSDVLKHREGRSLQTNDKVTSPEALASSTGRQTHTSDTPASSTGRQTHTSDTPVSSTGRQTHTSDTLTSSAGRQGHTSNALAPSTGRQGHTSNAQASSTGRQAHTNIEGDQRLSRAKIGESHRTTYTDDNAQLIPVHVGLRGSERLSDQQKEDDLGEFIQHVRRRTKRFFLGGFKPSITESLIDNYIKSGDGPKVESVYIITPKYGSDVIIRLTVAAQNSQVLLQSDFWPEGVRCRPWYSRRTSYNNTNNQGRYMMGSRGYDAGNSDRRGDHASSGANRYPRDRNGRLYTSTDVD